MRLFLMIQPQVGVLVEMAFMLLRTVMVQEGATFHPDVVHRLAVPLALKPNAPSTFLPSNGQVLDGHEARTGNLDSLRKGRVRLDNGRRSAAGSGDRDPARARPIEPEMLKWDRRPPRDASCRRV